MATAWISIFGILGVATTSGLGFATNRSDNGVSIVANLSSSDFHADHRISTGLVADEKIRTTEVTKISRDAETKDPGETKDDDEKCSSCSEVPSRPTDDVFSSDKAMTIDDRNVSDVQEATSVSGGSQEPKNLEVTLETNSDSETPRNVVLLLVDDAGSDGRATWKIVEAENEFSVQGYLKNSLQMTIMDGIKVTFGGSRVSGAMHGSECDKLLRANVGVLLMAAHRDMDMKISTFSATNFSFPSAIDATKNFDGDDVPNVAKKEISHHRLHVKPKKNSIEPKKSSTVPDSIPKVIVTDSVARPEVVNGYDGMWDLFDMFSRIRTAFFRVLLESFVNENGPDDEFPGRIPFLVQPSAAELVIDTLRDLKSVPTENGFMMAIAAPASKFSSIVTALRSEVSEDTLLVISGMCSNMNEPVRFLANGPGGKALRAARAVWELPLAVRAAMTRGCRGVFCKEKRRAEPLDAPAFELVPVHHDYPRKRIVRANEHDETISSTLDDKTTKDSPEVENTTDDKTVVPELGKRSDESGGASASRVDSVTAVLGMVTSITAMRALNS